MLFCFHLLTVLCTPTSIIYLTNENENTHQRAERCTNEVMSVGINSVREILVRVPALLREPDMGDFIEGTNGEPS